MIEVKSLAKIKIVKKVGSYITKEKILRYPLIDYPHVSLSKNNKKHTKLIHRMLAECFIPNPENKLEVNHIDGNPKNFSLHNLEWVTKSENQKHAFKIGSVVPRRGEANEQCILSDKQVNKIRSEYKTGDYTTRMLGLKYGVSCGYISMLINNKKRCQ